MTVTTTPSASTAHVVTPLPDDTATETAPSGFDVVPGESSIREPTQIDFLVKAWATSLSRSHHFHLKFLPGHIVSSMVNRQCMTICPSGFSFSNDRITVKYTDQKNNKHTESILCQNLAPFSPQKGGGFIMFTEGERAGTVCSALKAHWIWLTWSRK